MPATVATDGLIQTVATPLIKLSMDSHTPQLWHETYTMLTYRYNYQFSQVTANLADVMFDIEASYAVMVFAATGHLTNVPQKQIGNQTVNMYSINQTSAPGSQPPQRKLGQVERHAQFWVKQVNGNDLLNERSALMQLYRKTEQVFTPNMQNTAVGLFFLVQVYNTSQINSRFTDDPVKWGVDRVTSWTGLLTSSFAALDQFAGARFGQVAGKQVFTEFMKTEGAELLGNSVASRITSALGHVSDEKLLNLQSGAKFGKWATSVTKSVFRWLPVAGAGAAAAASAYQLGSDLNGNQNGLATSLSGVGMLVNGAAAYCAWVALVPGAAPIMAVAAVVLGVSALVLEVVRANVMDDETQLFLKGSFWGRGSYDYGQWHTINQRITAFSSGGTAQENVLKAMKKELIAFANYLYKPIPRLFNVSHNGDFSMFTLHLLLPGFVPLKSDVSVYFQGYSEKDESQLLLSHSRENRWATNDVNGKIQMVNQHTAALSFEVDEAKLSANYGRYKLNLTYHNPAGYPVSLIYPDITISDDKQWFGFGKSEPDLQSFEIEKASDE